MKIIISDAAKLWFQTEMDVETGQAIRFFARYGGSSPLHDSFSLGMTIDQPEEPVLQTTIDGVLYYIEERDQWFLDGHDLYVSVNEKLNELKYEYKKA